MADSNTPKDPAPKRKLPPDARQYGNADYVARRYRDKGKISSTGRLTVNTKLTGGARHLYQGEMQSVEYTLSESEVIMFLKLCGEIPEGNKDRLAVVYDKKTGKTCSITISKPLALLGIEVPKGRNCIAPMTVEDVEEYGPCIVLELKVRDYVATKPTGQKDQGHGDGQKDGQKTEQQHETQAAAGEADKSQEKK